MEETRQIAMFCVGRAVFFGCFAISIVMLSFAFNGILLFRSGAFLTLIMSLVLLWYAQTAHRREPKVTETWIYLKEERRPYNDHAKRAFREMMKEVYGFYAYYAVLVALGLFVISLFLQATGIDFGFGG